MVEMLDVLDAFSTPLKVAWVVWLAWGVGQLFWYRRERVVPAPKPPLPPTRPRPRRPEKPAAERAAEAAPTAPAGAPTLESAEVS